MYTWFVGKLTHVFRWLFQDKEEQLTDVIRRSAEEYDAFHTLARSLSARQLVDDAYLFGSLPQDDGIDLALMGITHG